MVPSFPNTMQHEPCGFLCDLDVTIQLHVADAFEAGHIKVYGEYPLAKGNLGTFKGRSDPHLKGTSASRTMVGKS